MAEAHGSKTQLIQMLSVESTTAQRMTALSEVLSPESLRLGLGKTPEAFKAWLAGAEPRPDAARALDNLRCAVLTLLEDGGKDPRQVERWLTSRLSAHSRPAIELILAAPEPVLAAADAEAESRAVSVEILEGVTAALKVADQKEAEIEAGGGRRRS